MSENEIINKDYVTIIELKSTDDKGQETVRTINLFSDSPEGAFANTLQIEQLYKTKNIKDVVLIGTYSRANLVVVDRNKQEK